MTRATCAAIVVLAIALSACSSSGSRASSSRPPPRAAVAGASDVPAGQDAVEDAYTLWTKMRVNAEKAIAGGAADPNKGWLDRALESDGRALIEILARPQFDSFAAERDELRARVIFVIKPPAPEDRKEAVLSVDQSFAAILKRRRGPAAPG